MYLFFYSSRLEFSNKTRSMDGRSRSNILFVRRRIWRSSSIRKLQQIWKRLLSRLSSYLSRQFIYQFLFWICHFLLPWVHVSLPKQAHWRSRRSRPRPCFWSVSRGYRNSARISNMVLFILHHNDHAWNGQCCNNLQFFSQRERIFQIFKKKRVMVLSDGRSWVRHHWTHGRIQTYFRSLGNHKGNLHWHDCWYLIFSCIGLCHAGTWI